MSGTDSVAQLRGRWTPALTAAALQRLLGLESAIEIPSLELDGRTQLDLRGIRIEQIQLDGAQLRDANLRWATVRDVGFKGASLVGCDLSQAHFTDCYFRRAAFERCDIVNARFENSDFSGARFDACRLDFSAFAGCEIAFDSIRFRRDAAPQVLARICRNLKLNAMSMGRFTDASDLAYLERTFDRHALRQRAFGAGTLSTTDRLHAVAFWLDAVMLNWLWGYGEKPWRLATAMVAAIVAFGTLQYWLQGVPGRDWFDHVYFSGVTFLTIGYGDLAPVGVLPRLLALIEGAAGILFIGMLVASATKKIMYR